MSSDFTNADMAFPAISDFIHTHLEKSGTNNQWIIESTPANENKADEYGYSKKRSYVSIDSTRCKKWNFIILILNFLK